MREQIKKAGSWLRGSWIALLACALGLMLTIALRMSTLGSLLSFVAVSAVFGVLIRLFMPRKDLAPPSTRFETDPQPLDVVDLGRAEDYIDTHYDPGAINYFVQVFSRLPDHLSRVEDCVRMTGRTVRSTTHLLFQGVADTRSDTVLVPVVWAEKGALFADFKAFDQRGDRIPTLTKWQVGGLIVVTVRALLESALRSTVEVGAAELDITDRLTLLEIVRATCNPVFDEERQIRVKKLAELVDGLDDKFPPAWKKLVREFCESLLDISPLVAEVDRSDNDNLMVGYSYTATPELIGRETKRRAKHGLLPTKLDVPNPLAFQSGSYHFEAFPGDGDMYVYDQRIEYLATAQEVELVPDTDHAQRWFIRKDKQDGSSAAHLYVRRQGLGTVPGNSPHPNIARSTANDVKSVVEFREVPPGALSNAVTAAFVTAVIVTFFAVFRVGIDPVLDLGSNNNQDIPALMLTVPAFLAAAVGRGMTAERLLSTSLTAFYGLWLVVGTSLCAVLLYIYSANRVLPFDVSIAGVTGLDYKINPFWIVLALFSIGVLLFLRKRKHEERRHYLKIR